MTRDGRANSPVRLATDGSGAMQAKSGTGSDPGHAPHAQVRLDEARFRLAAIAEASDDAIVGKDLNGVVTSWNKAAETMFGYPADEIIGQPITLVIPPDRIDEEQARSSIGFVAASASSISRRSGAARMVVSSRYLSPYRRSATIRAGLLASPRSPATSATRSVSAANSSIAKRCFTPFSTRVPDALIVIDRHGLIQSFSDAAARLFGFSAAEATGLNVSMLMPSPYREEHDHYLARYRATGERHIIGSGRIVVGRRKDGSTFPMELTVGEVNLPGTQRFTGFVRDLTEHKDRERRVSELQAELVHLVASDRSWPDGVGTGPRGEPATDGHRQLSGCCPTAGRCREPARRAAGHRADRGAG